MNVNVDKNINIIKDAPEVVVNHKSVNISSDVSAQGDLTLGDRVENIDGDKNVTIIQNIYLDKQLARRLNIEDNEVKTPRLEEADLKKLILNKINRQIEFEEELEDYLKIPRININSTWTEDGITLTLLYCAVQSNNEQGVKILLHHGANPDVKSNDGWSALHLAAQLGSTSIVSLLLSHGAHIDQHNNLKNSPLEIAARFDKLEVARLLLRNGANVNNQMKSGWTPLHAAVTMNNEDMVHLLCRFNADLNLEATSKKIDPSGGKVTPMKVAKKKRLDNIVEILERKKKEEKVKVARWGKGKWSDVSDAIVEKIRAGGDIGEDLQAAVDGNRVDVNGFHIWKETTYNLLFHAIQWKNAGAVETLLKSGADVNWRNERGSSALQLAVKSGQESIIDSLLIHGANVAVVNRRGLSPLHVATAENQVQSAALLLTNGADANIQMSSGWTPLHNAVMADNTEMMLMLLQNGARPDIGATNKSIFPDGKRVTARALAEIKGFDNAIRILKSFDEGETQGAVSKDVLSQNFAGESRRGGRGCYNCGEEGHKGKYCPQNGGGRDGSRRRGIDY